MFTSLSSAKIVDTSNLPSSKRVFCQHPRPHQGGLSYHLSHRPNVTLTISGRRMPARSISWATNGRCSSSVILPPARAGSSSCSACFPGISTEQLRSRLNRMVADGLLTRQRYREVPPRVDYELTERSRELIPVLGALARWGYDWTWTAPRPGEDVNVGAIFRLAPGMLEPPAGLEGTVELIVEAEGDAPERQYLVTLAGGRAEISEVGGAPPTATVRGTVQAWVRALGPGGIDRVAADLRPRRPRRRGARRLLACKNACSLGGRLVRALTSQASPASQRGDSIDPHDLVARCLTPDHADARSRHPCARATNAHSAAFAFPSTGGAVTRITIAPPARRRPRRGEPGVEAGSRDRSSGPWWLTSGSPGA